MGKVFIEETTLTNIGSAIREKTGKTDLIAPGAMPDEIRGIVSGGSGGDGPTAEDLVYEGDCSYVFSTGNNDWIINKFGHLVTTKDISNMTSMFENAKTITNIPFELNCKTAEYEDGVNVNYLFAYCEALTNVPKINGLKVENASYMFSNCYHLREIPYESVKDIDWSYVDSRTSTSGGYRPSTLYNCMSLRSFPMEFLNHGNPMVRPANSIYTGLFQSCQALDEVIGLPVLHRQSTTFTSNAFSYTFQNCHRLRHLTFKVDTDGTPIECPKWKSQTIDLSSGVGYSPYGAYAVCGYNSGITQDKEVTDDTTYQALKNDPDWFSCNSKYSRYNHDSAVETINSLPDVSASGGTNTIKFLGASGELTDGGAINTLTEEEIAVATIRGWTVSLV